MGGLVKHCLASFALIMCFAAILGLKCPDEQSLQLGTTGTIECHIPFRFVRVCWYEGTSFKLSPPIVCLEDGTISYTEEYDIAPTGSLVIIDASLPQEGAFTVVAFHPNGTYEHSIVNVQMIAYPVPYFPVISLCNGTQNCSAQSDTAGSVQCSIYGARPALELKLLSNGVTLINVTHATVMNKSTGLTDITIKAQYKSVECAHLSTITCIATDLALQEIISTLTLHDDCLPIFPTDTAGKGSGGVAVIITLVIIVIIVVAVVVTIYFIKRRQDYQPVKTNAVEVPPYKDEQKETPQEENTYDKKTKPTVKDNKETLLKALSEKYRDDYFGSASNEEDRIISIDDVYIDLDFENKDGRSEVKTFKIDEMFTAPFTTDKKRRLFISNKMQLTFTSHFAYLWSKQTTKDNILLVFNMLDVPHDSDIVTTTREMLQDQLPLTDDDLIKVIKKFGCHVILEGVEVKHIVGENENEASSEIEAHGDVDLSCKLSVGNILRDQKRKIIPKNIFQWVIIYDRDSVTSTNDIAYEVLLIKELTLSFMKYFDNYIDTVIDHYCRPSPDEKKKDVKTAVKEVTSQCELKKRFEKAPALLMQMIHLVTKMCLNNADTSTTAQIGSLLTKSMSLLKMRYLKKCSLHDADSLTFLEEKLGEVAYNQLIGNASITLNISGDVVKFSKSIGLIKQSDSADLILFPSEWVKYFLSACFMKDKEILSRFINQTIQSEDDANNDGRFQILSFTCALQPSFSHQICEKILKKGRMYYFLNCFCEASNADEFHAVIKKYLEKDDFVISVYDHKPHLAKVSCLLKYCNKWEITVSQMRFDRTSWQGSTATVFKTNKMPAVEKIVFKRIQLNEEDTFMYYIKWLMQQNVKIVSFEDCGLPEFSATVKFEFKDILSKSTSKVVFKKIETDWDTIQKYDLNKEGMKWIFKGTDKISKKKKKDTKGGHHDKENAKERSSEEKTVKNQTKNKTTDQAPGKPPRGKTPPSEASNGNNKEPYQAQTSNESDKSVSINATKPEDAKNTHKNEDITDVNVSEQNIKGKSKEKHPGMENVEEKKAAVVSGENENDGNGTAESEGNENDPNVQ